jgi:hypothetical protein
MGADARMKSRKVLKSALFSSDFILSILVVLGITAFVHGNIPVTTAKEILLASVAIPAQSPLGVDK